VDLDLAAVEMEEADEEAEANLDSAAVADLDSVAEEDLARVEVNLVEAAVAEEEKILFRAFPPESCTLNDQFLTRIVVYHLLSETNTL